MSARKIVPLSYVVNLAQDVLQPEISICQVDKNDTLKSWRNCHQIEVLAALYLMD